MNANIRLFNVEIFNKDGSFRAWFPARSMARVWETAAKYEAAEKLSDLKLSYLVFQQNEEGGYKFLNNWHCACKINVKPDMKITPRYMERVSK